MSNYRRSNSGPSRPSSTMGRIPPYMVIPVSILGGTALYTYWYFQDEAPYTGRKRLLATSIEWERQQGDMQYKQLLQQYRNDILPPDHRASVTVKRVGSRIATAASKFLNEHHPNQSPGSPYTFTVVRSDQANAFVLPNNHIFVYTGIFRFVRNEDDLAAMLGHEAAHNLCRHAGERITGSILVSILARIALLLDSSGVLYSVFLPAAEFLHELPHSRDHEIEADYVGLHLAADACYDPRAAKRMFSAMKAEDSAQRLKSPEFMSTHPSYDTRLANFDNWMHGAMDKFNAEDGYRCQRIRKEMKLARQHAAMLATHRENKLRKKQ